MPAEPSAPTSPAPSAAPPVDEPTVPVLAGPPTAPTQIVPPQNVPPQNVPPPPAPPAPPEKWAGRVTVPGAAGPGQKKASVPVAPTAMMARYPDSGATRVSPAVRPMAPQPVYRRGRGRRFFGALFALLLLLAVPVVTAYVSYKLASGESPFVWPPEMDLSRIF